MRTIVLVIAVCLAGCKDTPGTSTSGKTSSQVSVDDISRAYDDGRLRFEMRGLKTDAVSTTYGGTQFTHRATVIALGDSSLAKRPYWLLYSVKRISGGDPGAVRKKDDVTMIFVRDGIGEMTEGGGYRTTSEKWEQEQIEVMPIALIPSIPIAGPAVRQ